MIFRKAELADRDRILELNQKGIIFEEEMDPTLSKNWTKTSDAKEYFELRITSEDKFAYVAEVNNLLTAFLVGSVFLAPSYRVIKKIAEIDMMFIEKEYRGCGIGTRLSQIFVDWANLNGSDTISVTATSSNLKALDFYRKISFVDSEITFEMFI